MTQDEFDGRMDVLVKEMEQSADQMIDHFNKFKDLPVTVEDSVLFKKAADNHVNAIVRMDELRRMYEGE